MIKTTSRLAVTVVSLAAVAAVNYTMIHNPIALILAFTLLIHELGHYFMAKYYGADVKLPIFIPFILFSIGLTYVANLADEHKPAVAMAGAHFASLFLVLLTLTNLLFKLFSTKFLLLLLCGEIVFNYFGSDGRRYRKAKRNKLAPIFSL